MAFATTLAIATVAPGAWPQSSPANALRLPAIFADDMVVQRGQPMPVWGHAAPRAHITVRFNRVVRSTAADARGDWSVTLPPPAAGGPFRLEVDGRDQTLRIANVAVGDVWIASGQSNMEFPLSLASDGAREVASAQDAFIRQFKVPTSFADRPTTEVTGRWSAAIPQQAGSFSAVGYYFAKRLRATTRVPIAIVNTTWGGSAIEAWMSASALGLSDSAIAAGRAAEASRLAAVKRALETKLGSLPTSDAGLVNGVASWADTALDDREWLDMPVPSYWEGNGFTDMDGIAWYRTSFDLTDVDVSAGVTLVMRAIDDDDITWVNGVQVGRTTGFNVERRYSLPASVIHRGRNVLAVRVSDAGGGGGINAPVMLERTAAAPRSLQGTWKFKVGAVSFQPDGQRVNKLPTILYNSMLHPLLRVPIAGVIWYQGESNANDMQQASAYRGQFESLIRSWRKEWTAGRRDFPFLWVQLPNFGTPDSLPPAQSAWATQRESMDAALVLPKTGRAVAIDVGEAGDIHPRNKRDVGDRLARVAEAVALGRTTAHSGPAFKSMTMRGDTAIVSFTHVDGGLHSRGTSQSVGGFAIAGVDRRWVWADARIVGSTVRVWSSRVRRPVAVRYAWANNPARANLYNAQRLPAAPFRTDTW